jgi:hypothetical protein
MMRQVGRIYAVLGGGGEREDEDPQENGPGKDAGMSMHLHTS